MKRIKKAIRGKQSYAPYSEHKLMEKYSLGYNELMEFPFEKYLEHQKILSLEAKEERKETEKQKDKVNT